ncbi:hypothetical protein AB0M80_36150 [Amycolatopsis sp. NPDC051045]
MVQPRSAILAGLQDMIPMMSTVGSAAGEPADSAVVSTGGTGWG